MASSITSQTGARPNGTAAATATTNAASTGKSSGLNIGASFDTFLALLTTQLKNQDPTNAMDTNAMTQQLVSFASVEQQINMNKNMQALIGLQQSSAVASATSMLGKRVEIVGDQLSLQNGEATLRLPPRGVATQALITIQNAAGNTVYSNTINLGDAATDWIWNGRDVDGKNQQRDGAYRVSVGGRTDGGIAQPITANVVGTATSTAFDSSASGGGTMMLNLGAVSVPFSAVRYVRS